MKIRFKNFIKKAGQRRKVNAVEKIAKNDKHNDDATAWTSSKTTLITEDDEEQRHDHAGPNDEASQLRIETEDVKEKDSLPLNFQRLVEQTIGKMQRNQVFFMTPELKTELMSRINQDFFEILQDRAAVGETCIDVHMGAAMHVVEEFVALQGLIQQTVMPSTTQDILFDLLEESLQPRITYHYRPMSSVAPDDAAKIATWTNEFINRLNVTCPGLEVSPEWSQDRDKLIDHYLEYGIRRNTTELLNKTLYLMSESDVREDSEGFLGTGLPGTISALFQKQHDTARARLPTNHDERVNVICNQELAKCIPDIQLKITTDWKDMGCGYLCALVNDTHWLYNRCQDRNDSFLHSDDFEKEGRQLVRDLTELSLHATRYLSARIMEELMEPPLFLTTVGDKDWECNDSPAPVQRAIVSLKEVFANVESWLVSSDYYYPKVLRACFDATVQTYLDSFFANTLIGGIRNPTAVAEELRDDSLRLTIFFNGATCEDYHGTGGFYTSSEINARLGILNNMAALVDPIVLPDESKGDIKALMLSLDDKGGDQNRSLQSLLDSKGKEKSDAVFHLIGLRKRHGPLESISWFRIVSSAQKELEEDERNGCDAEEWLKAVYRVPDLRNARSLEVEC